MKRFIFLFLIILSLVILNGCNGKARSVKNIETIQTATATPENVPTTGGVTLPPTMQPTLEPTFASTLQSEEAKTKLFEMLLTNGNCSLPCIWGITPGKSSKHDAAKIFYSLGSIAWVDSISGNQGELAIDLNDSTTNLIFNLYFYSEDDIITWVNIMASTSEDHDFGDGNQGVIDVYDSDEFGEIIKPYTLQQVLKTIGKPEAVLVQTFSKESSLGQNKIGGFDIVLLYPHKGIFAHYETQMRVDDGVVYGCFKNAHVELKSIEPGEMAFIEALRSTEWADFWPLPVTKPFWTSIDKATGMSIDDFFETFSNSMDPCLQTPTSLWEEPFSL
jgi:hypothetical protein